MKNIIKFKLTILLLFLFRLTFGQLPDIVAMEYYFDADPGYGNGIPVAIVADSTIEMNFDADLSAISSGFHILYVRIKDEYGNWSFVLTEGFLKSPDTPTATTSNVLPQISQMEYYFDTDPGFGNGLEVPITSDSLVDINFSADYGALNDGFHILYVRVKDEFGNWSLSYTQHVLKFHNPIVSSSPNILPQITQMEYFFDADPGFGNGTEISVTSDSLVEIAFDADYSALNDGFHVLYVRVKDEFGNWSILYTHHLLKFHNPIVSSSPNILPQLTQMEYFFDADPGFGNGTEILNTPDSLIIEDFFADISTLEPGSHLLYIRAKDEYNRWSLSFADYFTITGLLAFLEGPYDSITGQMSTNLNDLGLLPLEQPFDSDPAAVWYYSGNETVTSIPSTDIVDWILLQARDAISAENATSATIKENQVAFLLNNGSIVGLDGESSISFTEPINNELYLVIFQRNHLGVLSALPINTIGSNLSYNFSSGPDQVYGGDSGHKNLKTGVWGMNSGDGDGNGQVELDDKTVVWQTEAGKTSYLSGDYNLDGQVDNSDKNDIWLTNDGSDSAIPE